MTTGWEFEPHATLLKEARKKGVVGRGRLAKSAETRGKDLGFKEELEKIRVLVTRNG